MTTILIRTVIIYVFLLTIMRLMGKRQLGELEVSELVSTLFLSDIASLPICNREIPLLYAIIPIATITFFEVGMSFLLIKIPWLKYLISARPGILINKGKIDRKELAKNRITIDELISQLRQQGVTSPDDVEYTIIEQNGKMTVITKAAKGQPTCGQLGIKTVESGINHILIADGRIDRHGLQSVKKNKVWLSSTLKRERVQISDIFLMTMDDTGKVRIIRKGETAE